MVQNRPRLHPQRLTPINYRAYLYTRSLQSGYRNRIKSWKANFMRTNPIRSIPKPLYEKHPRMAVDMIEHFGIRVGDLVRILWGPDRNKRGVVLAVKRHTNQVIVEGCGLKEKRADRRFGRSKKKSSLTYVESPIHVTNVRLLDPVTKTYTEVKLRKMLTGEKVRLSSRSGCAMPDPAPITKPSCRKDLLYFNQNIIRRLTLRPLRRIIPVADQGDGYTSTALHILARNSRITRHQSRIANIMEKQRSYG